MTLRHMVPVQAESQMCAYNTRNRKLQRTHFSWAHTLSFLRFGAVPEDAAEADAFISDLYVHLVEEAAVVLNHRIK